MNESLPLPQDVLGQNVALPEGETLLAEEVSLSLLQETKTALARCRTVSDGLLS